MTYEEARARVEVLKGCLFDSTFSLSEQREIEELYNIVLRKQLRKCNCKDKYSDAVIELYSYLKTNKEFKKMGKYNLKRGVVLTDTESGAIYTSDNITDEFAATYLEKYPEQVKLFEVDESFEEDDEMEDSENAVMTIVDELLKGTTKKDIKAKYTGMEYEGKNLSERAVIRLITEANAVIKARDLKPYPIEDAKPLEVMAPPVVESATVTEQ